MPTTKHLPTSIRIFLASGTPDGIRIVEKSNWTGKAVVAGRSQMKDALQRPELTGPGVYILTGPGEGIARRIYIGESDTLATRLKQHGAKEFWTQFIAFTSTNEGLNKASVRYLETQLVNLAREANRWEIENDVVMEQPVLSEPDRADAEWFLAEMLQIYPILGVDAFSSGKKEATHDESVSSSDSAERLTLSMRGVRAYGRESGDEFIVLEGSGAHKGVVPSATAYLRDLRAELIERGVLEKSGDRYRFTQDYPFSSPSQAAGVIVGGSTNGRTAWKDERGRTLRELQDGEG